MMVMVMVMVMMMVMVMRLMMMNLDLSFVLCYLFMDDDGRISLKFSIIQGVHSCGRCIHILIFKYARKVLFKFVGLICIQTRPA
jgi:hypothetical protein